MVMSELKIALISPWKVRCGIFSYSRDLSDALAQLGVDVYVIRWPRFGALTPDIVTNIVDKIPVDKVDLIHVQEEYGLFKGLEADFYVKLKMLGKPIVSTCHAVGTFPLDGIIAENSDSVIVHNQFCMRNFPFPDNLMVIPHGCKPAETKPVEESKRALGIDTKIPVVGTVGFISTYKGLEILIEAMRDVPEAALLIGGGWHTERDTDYIIDLKRKSLEFLEGRCQWLGYVEDDMLSTVYGAIDLFVYPSRHATESGALLTAMGYGKAILASKIPPFEEKMPAVRTFRDSDDLSKKIRSLIKDEKTRKKMENRARSYAEANNWDSVAEKHLELYRDVLSAKTSNTI